MSDALQIADDDFEVEFLADGKVLVCMNLPAPLGRVCLGQGAWSDELNDVALTAAAKAKFDAIKKAISAPTGGNAASPTSCSSGDCDCGTCRRPIPGERGDESNPLTKAIIASRAAMIESPIATETEEAWPPPLTKSAEDAWQRYQEEKALRAASEHTSTKPPVAPSETRGTKPAAAAPSRNRQLVEQIVANLAALTKAVHARLASEQRKRQVAQQIQDLAASVSALRAAQACRG
jgi:hypothetical protein